MAYRVALRLDGLLMRQAGMVGMGYATPTLLFDKDLLAVHDIISSLYFSIRLFYILNQILSFRMTRYVCCRKGSDYFPKYHAFFDNKSVKMVMS